jgi:outer membrane lipoprotein carrier protein
MNRASPLPPPSAKPPSKPRITVAEPRGHAPRRGATSSLRAERSGAGRARGATVFTHRWFLPAALFLVILTSTSTLRAADPLDEIFAKLAAQPALAGDFTQQNRSGLSGLVQTESGKCVLAKGGRARFDYAEPAGKMALSDGRDFLLYVPKDKQLIRQAMPEDSAPALLFRGAALLRKHFDITAASVPASDGGGWRLELRPLEKESAWDKIQVEISTAGLPTRITFHDPTGGSTELKLTLHAAPSPADSLFTFTPPPGTEILSEDGEK